MKRIVGTTLCLVLTVGWLPPARAATAAPADTTDSKTESGTKSQPAANPPADPGQSDPATLAEARDLYARGEARYETFDYEAAIDLWTQAYAKLRESPESRPVRAALVYNIATARVNSYSVDKDVRQLHRAKLLLQKYINDYVELYGDNFETLQEISKIKAKQDEIDRMIDEVQRTGSAQVGQKDAPVDLADVIEGPTPAGADDRKDGKKIGTLGYVGIAIGALGVISIAIMAAGLARGSTLRDDYEQPGADRQTIESDGLAMNAMAIGAGAAGGVLIATGVVLIVVDIVKRKKRNSGAARLRGTPTGLALSF